MRAPDIPFTTREIDRYIDIYPLRHTHRFFPCMSERKTYEQSKEEDTGGGEFGVKKKDFYRSTLMGK